MNCNLYDKNIGHHNTHGKFLNDNEKVVKRIQCEAVKFIVDMCLVYNQMDHVEYWFIISNLVCVDNIMCW